MLQNPSTVYTTRIADLDEDRANWSNREIHDGAEMEPALDGILAEMKGAGYTRKELFGVRLALEEAIINAIKHGHRYDATKTVHVRYRVSSECIVAEIADEGPGFDLQRVLDPLAADNIGRDCGRGLLLMRSYMNWVRYNPTGTCVTLCKLRAT